MSGPAMDPARYAALVRDTPDDQLEAGMTANREFILTQIFDAMPASFQPAAAGDRDFVAEWRITDRPGGGEDRWQVAIRDGECRVGRNGDEAAQVTLTVGPVDFVKLVAGAVHGPQLFMTGRLRIEGDLLLAARLDELFRPPGGGSSDPGGETPAAGPRGAA